MYNKTAFVTGEAGSLASHLIYDLCVKGVNVINENTCFVKRKCTSWSRELEVDILSNANLQQLKLMKPDIIFHLAGLVGTPRCQQDQELAINTNVMATNNIAEAYTPGQLIVYFGTTVMHDTQAPRPFHEETPIKAETLYGLTKYMGEEILTMKVRPEDLLIIRPCFVYGGKYDHASVITSMIRATLSNSPTLNIKVPLDPYNLKDYYYIDDFLSDLMLLIDNKARGVFNLSKGTPIHFGYVLDELYKRNLVPKGLKLLPKEDYLGDHHTTDKKARDIIGSTNKIEIGEGIDKIVEELQNDR